MPGTIEAIERATLAAVQPQSLEAMDGWLLALDDGTVGRAHSAVPTRHDKAVAAVVPDIEARYRAHGLDAVFRIPQSQAFDGVRAVLRDRGYVADKPTFTLGARAADVAAVSRAQGVELARAPDDSWASVFLGQGFDPVNGQSRLRILRRSQDSVFASVRQGGRVVAVGLACISQGWCGFHGMRTAPDARGQGFAARILAALAIHALGQDVQYAFLQVEQASGPARALYQRAGFKAEWICDYWQRRAG